MAFTQLRVTPADVTGKRKRLDVEMKRTERGVELHLLLAEKPAALSLTSGWASHELRSLNAILGFSSSWSRARWYHTDASRPSTRSSTVGICWT
jgi:hypothetical protein